MTFNFKYRNILLALVCTLPLVILIVLSVKSDYATLIYTLDDPYIHLELAKNIFNGNYGINDYEFSSPSSSILWPFLLSPFSIFSWYEYAPLILNYFFLVLTFFIIFKVLI